MKLQQFHYSQVLIIALILSLLVFFHKNLLKNDNFKNENQSTKNATDKEIMQITSHNDGLKRLKRFIIFNGSGVVKLVLGTTFPIILPDKKRSLNQFYNLQLQYVPPPIPLYWWSLYDTSTFAARKQRSANMLMHYDNSRAFIYKFIETILERSGNFGNECLLKVICEVARAPLSEDLHVGEEATQGKDDDEYENENENESESESVNVEDYGGNIYHKLINAIFTPVYSNVDERYTNARDAGLNGANCDETFGECSVIDDWLERFTRFI